MNWERTMGGMLSESYSLFKLEVQILSALEKKGWSYDDLAKATGTSKSNISRDLKDGGLEKAALSRIQKIAKALGMQLVSVLIPEDQAGQVISVIDAVIRGYYESNTSCSGTVTVTQDE